MANSFKLFLSAISCAALLASATFANAAENSALQFSNKSRNYISIVGSSTVYPFSAAIAEKFGRQKKFRTPTVEATGTGGGFKLFCSGVGFEFPDFSNASRKIEESEIERCAENGIKNVGEIKIGYDGIVLANSVAGKKFTLSKRQIFLALADKIPYRDKLIANPFYKWNQIDPSLPSTRIRVYGPPSTSGTRDSFVELVLEKACINIKEFVSFYPNTKIRQGKCRTIRSDGTFIEAGENDNLILQKLHNDHDALGIFGFSFLIENKNSIQAATVDGVAPSFDSIISGKYSISRPLFIYFKREHLDKTPGMREFINAIVSKDALGPDGYLMQKGLIPLSDSELKKMRDEILKGL